MWKPRAFLFPPFDPSVLKPNFYLNFIKSEFNCEVLSFLSDNILLLLKLVLQTIELLGCENRSLSLVSSYVMGKDERSFVIADHLVVIAEAVL